jgi:hypothetical protein
MEKDSTLAKLHINAYYIVSSAARVNSTPNPGRLSVKMAMTTETYMDRRLSVPLCMDNWSHHNTNKQEISEATVETQNRVAKPSVDV